MTIASLQHAHWMRIHQCIETLYRFTTLDAFPASLLKSLNHMIGCEHSSYNEMPAPIGKLKIVTEPHVQTIFDCQPQLEHYIHEHPFLAHWHMKQHMDVCCWQDFTPLSVFKTKALYNEFYKPIDAHFQIGFRLSRPNECFHIVVVLNRFKKPFSETERLMLSMTYPHILNALNTVRHFALMERQLKITQQTLSTPANAAFIDDETATLPLPTNETIHGWEAYFPDHVLNAQTLPEPLARWITFFATHPTQLAKQIASPFATLKRKNTLTIPIPSPQQNDPSTHLYPHGLTLREMEALFWICQGKTHSEIALALNISTRTVHKHVERVYMKLKVGGRHAACGVATHWPWETLLPHSPFLQEHS